jgi:phosphoglycolate phosphatase-like HAD superfamily hydrolase
MVRLVLFDIDGTLIQSGGAGEKAFAEVARTAFNLAEGTKGLHFAGRTDPAVLREMFERHGIATTPENFERFLDAYVARLRTMIAEISGRVLPGVEGWISALQAMDEPPLLGLLTGNIRRGAQIKLTHYKLWHHFQTGGFSDDNEDRCGIAAIARDRGGKLLNRKLSGDEILVIGDTQHDITCGQSIGARVLAVGTGMYKSEELLCHKPTWCVPTLEHITPEKACFRVER